MDPPDHGAILRRDAVSVELRAPGGWDPGSIDQIFDAPGNAVQRAAILPGGDFSISLARLS